MSTILIEAAAFTPSSALEAARGGADRIELCSGFAEGGLSPSAGTVAMVREKTDIPINVMVRPRVGDFVYNADELLAMEKEILYYKQIGVNGIVLGVLNEKGEVNVDALKHLVHVARPMSVTFHRAFDQCANLLQELDKLIDCGVDRVLTSGGKPNVTQGLEVLKQLIEHAGYSIIILPGGGITAANANEIVNQLGVKELHLSGKKMVTSAMSKLTVEVNLCSPSEVFDFHWYECDAQRIRAVKELF